jgi:hypothetical protein
MADENQETPAGTGAAASDQGADSLDAVMGAYRDQAKQLPGLIPELVQGKTLAEVNSSIDAAKAAFERVKGQVSGSAAAAPAAPVGTGAAPAAPAEPVKLSGSGGFDKILAGVEGKGKQSR